MHKKILTAGLALGMISGSLTAEEPNSAKTEIKRIIRIEMDKETRLMLLGLMANGETAKNVTESLKVILEITKENWKGVKETLEGAKNVVKESTNLMKEVQKIVESEKAETMLERLSEL